MLTKRLPEGMSGPKLDVRLNPVALFIYLVLVILSGGIAFWLVSEDVAVGWIVAQVLVITSYFFKSLLEYFDWIIRVGSFKILNILVRFYPFIIPSFH